MYGLGKCKRKGAENLKTVRRQRQNCRFREETSGLPGLINRLENNMKVLKNGPNWGPAVKTPGLQKKYTPPHSHIPRIY